MLFYPNNRHQRGNVKSESSVEANIIPVAYVSSPLYLEDKSAVVTGAGIPAISTVIPRKIAGTGSQAVTANTIAGITIRRTDT